MSAEGVDELGHLLVALDAAEGSLGVEHAGRGPAQHRVVPSRQRLTFLACFRQILIIDSIPFNARCGLGVGGTPCASGSQRVS